jgi:SAM-dependent methyltransferase
MRELTPHEKQIAAAWPPKNGDWHRRAVGGQWETIGPLQKNFLVSQGLMPEHRVLDIGCGSLRAGVAIADYLNPGRYFGFDHDSSIIKAATEIEIQEHNLEEKLLNVFLVDDSVFTHLDPPDIELSLKMLMPRLAEGGTFFATFNETDGEADFGHPYPIQMLYPLRFFEEMAAGLGLTVERIGPWGHPANKNSSQLMLAFRHGDVTVADAKPTSRSERRAVASGGRRRGTIEDWEMIWQEFLPWGDRSGTVLDAGCGEHHWECDDWRVQRCDSFQVYDAPERKLGSDVKNVDLNEPWPYSDNEFAGVISADVIEHLENLWFFFREAMRVSRDFVIVTTPYVESEFSKRLFLHNGWLWSFFPEGVSFSHHITPIFEWQLKVVEQRSGWKLDRKHFINIPFEGIPMHPEVRAIADTQPTQRKVVVRFVSPEAAAMETPQ